MRVPRTDVRQRLGFEVIVQGREVAPRWIAAGQLEVPGQESQSEQQPVKQQHDQPRRGVNQEDRQEAAFQQQRVPLKAHEYLSRVNQRQIQHEQRDQRRPRPDPTERQQQRADRTGAGGALQRCAAAVQPEQRRQSKQRAIAEFGEGAVQQALKRQDAVRARQTFDLYRERHEGRGVHQRQTFDEQPGNQFVIGRRLEQIRQNLQRGSQGWGARYSPPRRCERATDGGWRGGRYDSQ